MRNVKKRVGIIGYGSIGRSLARYIADGRAGETTLAAVLVRDQAKVADAGEAAGLLTDDPDDFFRAGLDVVVEAAGHGAVEKFAERSLRAGCDLLVASVGAFANQPLFDRVMLAAQGTGKRVIVPSCAVGGLDRIAAGAIGTLDEVTLTSRKPPRAWYGTVVEKEVNLAEVSQPICVFEGPARESALLFPESVNVSAALSLAGIGFERTKVRVIVDPTIKQNVHEIFCSGQFGQISLQLSNTPSENPKTGYIVAMSMAKVLANLSSPFVIGL